jgi:Putative prokaryotic signal transducing protein
VRPAHLRAPGDSYPVTVPVDHHNHDRIVELTTVPSRFEAEILVTKLQANGIEATARHDDGGGWAPYIGRLTGHGVMVFESDFAKATELIAEP